MGRRPLRPDPIAYAPIGLSREEAARYIGVSTTKFDQLVNDGRMPRAKKIDGRKVWNRALIDLHFAELPDAEPQDLWSQVAVGQ